MPERHASCVALTSTRLLGLHAALRAAAGHLPAPARDQHAHNDPQQRQRQQHPNHNPCDRAAAQAVVATLAVPANTWD